MISKCLNIADSRRFRALIYAMGELVFFGGSICPSPRHNVYPLPSSQRRDANI